MLKVNLVVTNIYKNKIDNIRLPFGSKGYVLFCEMVILNKCVCVCVRESGCSVRCSPCFGGGQ